MKILIDTHILLWWLDDNPKLTETARQHIRTPSNTVYVSHASLWEIQIKNMTGKLNVNLETLVQHLPQNQFQQFPIHANHILTLGKLPPHHQDPFDRMLISQAISEPLNLMSYDRHIALYDVPLIKV